MKYNNWKTIDWNSVSKIVGNLQGKIFEASRNNDLIGMYDLQNSLISNKEAKLLSIRSVTQDNRGKKTAGIDNIIYLGPEKGLKLLDKIQIDGKCSPIIRVWIPKPGKKEKRPLGIPTIKDRVKQQLVKLALEPQWEAKFEKNSYGFRPGRNAMDVTQQLQRCLKNSERFILDGDIRKCFDRINHDKLLEKINPSNLIKKQIRVWLKAGILDPEISPNPIENDKETPQGGVISPLLANIALHGLEEFCYDIIPEVSKELVKKGLIQSGPQIYRNKTYFHFIGYADDFVFIHPSIEIVKAYKEKIPIFLSGIGLELNSEKSKIGSSLNTIIVNGEKIPPGLDFLGFHFILVKSKSHRAKDSGGKVLGYYLSVLPSFDAIIRQINKLANILDRRRGISEITLINLLAPKIKNFANYYGFIQSKKRLSYIDHHLHFLLRKWCYGRHPNKTRKWCINKYFKGVLNGSWVFADENSKSSLFKMPFHSSVKIEKYHPVSGDYSPFNPEMMANEKRLKLNVTKSKLFKTQKGICKWCLYPFVVNDITEIHHILPNGHPKREYLQNQWLIHGHCHDELHANFKFYPITKEVIKSEELYEG